MQNEQKLDLVLERFYNRFNKYNTKVLQMLGETIKQFDGLTPTEAHQLAQELKYSTNIQELLNELSRISGRSIEDMYKFFDNVAEENVEFSETYYDIKGKEYIPYEENDRLKRYIDTIKMDTLGTFINLSRQKNIGFTTKLGEGTIFRPLETVYQNLIDEAVFNVSTGVTDYQSAMRNTIKQLANSGVRVNEEKTTYTSGYTRRIDSSVRQAILTGVRKINIGIQQRVGEEFGADGIEVSYHFPCADDHWEINGKQYKAKENETIDQLLDRINSHLVRPIGELNCTHYAFSIIYGVNLPNYSKEYINMERQLAKQTFSYKGKEYTPYQATQQQRKMETAIRKQKDNQIIARASGDKEGIAKAQSKITQLTKEYKNFSNIAGLEVYKERLTVSGYRRVSTK